MLQILPLGEYPLVGLHLWTSLGPVETVGLELTDEIVENKGIGTLATIFGQHTNEQEVDSIGLVPLKYLQQVPPSKGQVTAVVGLLQGTRERGEGDAEAYQFVAIHDTCYEVEVGNLDVVVDQLVYLVIRQLTEAIKDIVGFVEQIEDELAPSVVD